MCDGWCFIVGMICVRSVTLKSKSIFKYVLSVALFFFLMSQVDFSVLLERSTGLNAGVVFVAFLLIICQIIFLNLRWHCLLNVGRSDVSFQTSSLINIAGYFANVLFITSVGGILTKSALAVRQGLSVTQSVFVTFFDRFMTLFALVFFSALGLPFLLGVLDNAILMLLVLSVLGCIFAVICMIVVLRSGVLSDYILSSGKRRRVLVLVRSYMEDYSLMLRVGGYSLIAQGCFILAVYGLSLGINEHVQGVRVIEFLALLPVLALISSLPISFGGWGVREGAFMYGLGMIGYSMESAFLLSVQVGVVTLIAPFLVGLPYLIKSDLRRFLVKSAISNA